VESSGLKFIEVAKVNFYRLPPKEALDYLEALDESARKEVRGYFSLDKLCEMAVFRAVWEASNRDSPTLELDYKDVVNIKRQMDGYRKNWENPDITIEDAIRFDLTQNPRWKKVWDSMNSREKESFQLRIEYLKKIEV
jgi:hypothetical protein